MDNSYEAPRNSFILARHAGIVEIMLNQARRLTPLNRLCFAAALVFALFPILWLLSKSFMPWVEYSANPAIWVTSNPTFDNYHNVFFDYVNLIGWPQSSSWRAIVSSTMISIIATFFSVAIGLLAGSIGRRLLRRAGSPHGSRRRCPCRGQGQYHRLGARRCC